MVGPGEYVPDITEGITNVEDLPKAKTKRGSRVYKKRPCPNCGYSACREKIYTRTLHDLGDLRANRPIDINLQIFTKTMPEFVFRIWYLPFSGGISELVRKNKANLTEANMQNKANAGRGPEIRSTNF